MIRINIDKAKAIAIAHIKRRAARDAELALLGTEASRQAIHAKYAAIQARIDACATIDDLTCIMDDMT